MIQAIIFDCFGVIITDALSALIDEFKQSEPEKVTEIIDLLQATNKGFIGRQEFGEHVSELMGITAEQYYQRLNDVEVKDRALLSYIGELRKSYKTAILSNVSYEGFWRRFTPDEIGPYFDAIVVSGEIGFAKPEAAAYELTADKLGVRLAECIMIDGREEHCDGARGVGMRAVLYESLPQLKGGLTKLGVRNWPG